MSAPITIVSSSGITKYHVNTCGHLLSKDEHKSWKVSHQCPNCTTCDWKNKVFSGVKDLASGVCIFALLVGAEALFELGRGTNLHCYYAGRACGLTYANMLGPDSFFAKYAAKFPG